MITKKVAPKIVKWICVAGGAALVFALFLITMDFITVHECLHCIENQALDPVLS
jgi:hypothetical protein